MDGIDKRIAKVKHYLRKTLIKKEFEGLWFSGAVVHTVDSSAYYMKIPFKDKKRPGFLLVKKTGQHMQYAVIQIEGYSYNAKRLRNKNIMNVTITSKNSSLNKKFTMYATGWVEKMSYPKPSNDIRDTGFSITPFLVYGDFRPRHIDSFNLSHIDTLKPYVGFEQFEAYLNTNFVFNDIATINHHKLHFSVVVNNMIPLAYEAQPSFTLEFSNSDILPSIDIKKMFGSFDAKADSVKKQ